MNFKLFLIATFVYTLLMSSCTHNAFECKSVDDQYKTMSSKDHKNLDRKQYKFKKAIPKQDKRESYSGT